MANAKGEVKLGDHVLRFGVNQLCAIEARFEQSAGEVFAAMQEAPRMTDIRAIFAIGLGVNDEEAGDVIDACGGFAVATAALAEAVSAAFPDPVEGADADPQKAASTG